MVDNKILLLFVLIFASLSFAPPSYLDTFPPILRDWVPLTILVTFTLIIFYGTILAISHGFNQRELGMHAKSEILQAFATLFIIILMGEILSSITAPDNMRNLIGGEVPCGGETLSIQNIPNAMDLIKCSLTEKAKVLADLQESSAKASESVLFLLSQQYSVYGVPVFNGQWVTSWYREAENYRIIYTLTTSLLISLNAQIKLVDYVKNNMLVLFLPVGIILRSFYFTRAIGAFFISIAFGLYFIFPLIFTVTDPGFVKSPPAPPPAQTEQANFCYPTFSGATVVLAATPLGGGAGSGFGLDIKNAASEISKVHTGIILHPFVALAITLVLVRYMTYILGGEPYEMMRYVAKVV